MKTVLRVLVVEDSEDDTLLVLHQINCGGYDIDYERVETAEKMKSMLEEKTWDIVLSDYQMPSFNGLEALKLLKESAIDIPFIIISGTIGEEVAVEAMKKGAHDYIMKNNMQRLLPAIERELKDAQSRAERKLFEQKKKEAEESLLESEERYRLIAENTADAITVLDLDLNILYASPSVQKLRGYSVQETLSQSLDQILTPKSFIKVKKAFADQLELEEDKTVDPSRSLSLELEEFHKNGSIIHVEISVSFIRDNELNPTRLLVVSRDITKRKLAEEKIKVLTHAVEQNPAMIIITDIEGNIEYVNPKFEGITGYAMYEVLGKKPSIIKSGKMPDSLYKEMWDTIKSGNVWRGELINKKKNDEFYWANLSTSPMKNNEGNITHFVGIQEDITERKKIEEELIIAKEHAEESDRLKTAFLQNMSHEIRTPMNAIIGFSTLMVSEYNNIEKLEEYSQIINHSCKDLLETIEGIIDIAKLESGRLLINNDVGNLKNLFNTLSLFFNEYKLRKDKQHIELNLQCQYNSDDIIIKTDLVKLKQVFINLISNAIKFTESGKIVGGCKFDKNQNLVFFVSDTGIGIPQDKHDIIFKRFVKVDLDKTKLMEGSGLGLAIVKELLDLIGGKIWFESEPFKGSTFYFTFPHEIIRN
jgi:PAS domain S-box-containing protein